MGLGWVGQVREASTLIQLNVQILTSIFPFKLFLSTVIEPFSQRVGLLCAKHLKDPSYPHSLLHLPLRLIVYFVCAEYIFQGFICENNCINRGCDCRLGKAHKLKLSKIYGHFDSLQEDYPWCEWLGLKISK